MEFDESFPPKTHCPAKMKTPEQALDGFFAYRAGELFCEEVSLTDVAKQFGTPCYVYSYSQIVQNYRVFDSAFSGTPHLIAYAVKANSNGAVLRCLAQEGCGADVVSEGELARALAAGIPPERVVFAGVGKRKRELERALEAKILLLNAESMGELEVIRELAEKHRHPARIAIRINPDVAAETHTYVGTGRAQDKFGIPVSKAVAAFRYASTYPELCVTGLHFHIGSQIIDLEPYRKALQVAFHLIKELANEGVALRYLDIGGGLGISYTGEAVAAPVDLAAIVAATAPDWEGTLIIEPGRAIVGDAGVLLTEVLYRKASVSRSFVVVDSGINDFIRPCLYQAQHRVYPVTKREGEREAVDVVGPVCESADVLARACALPAVKPGEYLAIRDVGAYGFSMASTYNSRPRPAEVMVKGKEAFLIREREDVSDLTAPERIPPFLR